MYFSDYACERVCVRGGGGRACVRARACERVGVRVLGISWPNTGSLARSLC